MLLFNMKNYELVLRNSYNPEVYDILQEGKPIAEIKTRWGYMEVLKYNSKETIFDLWFDDEYIGAIPENMKDDIFESIEHKLNKIKL